MNWEYVQNTLWSALIHYKVCCVFSEKVEDEMIDQIYAQVMGWA